MRLIYLASLLPLALAAPATIAKKDLTASDWASIQSGFTNKVWNKAAEYFAPPHISNDEEKTVWQVLQEKDEFSKLVKLIKIDGNAQKYLDDASLQITFFAPDNDAIPDPHHHDDHDHDEESDLFALVSDPNPSNLLTFLARYPAYEEHHHHHGHGHGGHKGDEERKKQIFKEILRRVLQYHGLERALSAAELAQNSTVATALKADFGSFGGLHRRIKIEKSFVPPTLKLNYYIKVKSADLKTKNGYIHTIEHPLFPAPSVLDVAFLFPDEFSTLTSAVQKVDGQKYLEWEYDEKNSKHGKPHFTGTGAVTLFAPTNEAFKALPTKLKMFLFSPWGKEVLAKVLAYHVLPDTILFAELLHVVDHHGHKHDHSHVMTDGDDISFHKELSLPSGLGKDKPLTVVVDKSKVLPVPGAVKVTISVNGEQVEKTDIPAINGAVHVIGKVLVPPHKHHDHDGNVVEENTWDNWESWLVEWAAEQ